ncbi:cysteine desulfurase [Pseudomonas guariconensis]|nr:MULTISPECIES: cysteine desulfurase family protein [Pseudomonas]MCO7643040.1 cysteine desulfurase [Pseudomonas sp. S 311-6]MCO7516181.1 cysteine desulfurase [Pseudomonas putida]MCO7567701.1 cysteine desulfurase [Pseudomonas mosselii]MCO7606025.1 cysteine desulfurase [Pseudomonas guariconensis]MCO7619092.1 cysteine desulfurase [Pseudomonas guariconensis]
MQPHPLIYLDAAATTPCAADVATAMHEFSTTLFGNPSSTHIMGRLAKNAILGSTAQISSMLGCAPNEITFTSGATESNNIVILGANAAKKNIVICPIDHKSSILAAEELERKNIEVRRMKIDRCGRIDLEHLSTLVDQNTALLSLSYVNSEIGTYQDLSEIRKILNKSSALFHIDAAQAVGKLPINVKNLGVDCVSISAHKIQGPKGIGALYASPSTVSRLRPLTFGGEQSKLRSGTLPTQLIVGFGIAAQRINTNSLHASWKSATQRRIAILETLNSHKISFQLNSPEKNSIPHILNISIPGIGAETIISCLDGVCVSSGSACNSNNLKPSHVITGIGYSPDRANSAIRLSFTSDMDINDIKTGVEIFAKTVLKLTTLNQ